MEQLIQKNLNEVWIIGDEHFNHDADFVYRARGYRSMESMNEALIEEQGRLPHGALLVHLGDTFMNQIEMMAPILEQLNAFDITHCFTRGNHCSRGKAAAMVEAGWIQLDEQIIFRYRNREIILSHLPLDIEKLNTNRSEDPEDPRSMPMVNIHAHTHQTNIFTKPYQACVSVDALCDAPIRLKDVIHIALDKNRAAKYSG